MSGTRRLHIALVVLMAGVLLGPSNAIAGTNDTMATAQGPVTSSIEGAINTENDVDWFFFYAEGSTQLDIALAGLGPEGSCFRWYVQLTDANGDELSEAAAYFNEVDHIRYTVASPGTYYLKVWGWCEDVGNYRIDINASPALLSAPPYIPPPPAPSGPSSGSPGVSASCRQAQARVGSLRTRLQRATNRRQRNRLRVKLRRARAQARRSC